MDKTVVNLFRQGQHIKIHQACMLILVFLIKNGEPVFRVKIHSRDISINGKETIGGVVGVLINQVLDNTHHILPYVLSLVILADGEPTDFNGWITAETLAFGKTVFYLTPSAVGYFHTTNLVVKQAEICRNLTLILQDESVSDALLKEMLCVLYQELVQIVIATIKPADRIVGR